MLIYETKEKSNNEQLVGGNSEVLITTFLFEPIGKELAELVYQVIEFEVLKTIKPIKPAYDAFSLSPTVPKT